MYVMKPSSWAATVCCFICLLFGKTDKQLSTDSWFMDFDLFPVHTGSGFGLTFTAADCNIIEFKTTFILDYNTTL